MIPRARQALADLAGRLGGRIAPTVSDPYAAVDSGLVSMLMTMLAEELEAGVAKRLTDGEALKALFQSAAAAPDAAARSAFTASVPSSLTLTEVSAWLDGGMTLLIDLHEWAEANDAAMNREIWAFLAEHTTRHAFPL
ncbi:MAG: hypothetical protein AAGE43_13325 [Pseudomonadota bacterium]